MTVLPTTLESLPRSRTSLGALIALALPALLTTLLIVLAYRLSATPVYGPSAQKVPVLQLTAPSFAARERAGGRGAEPEDQASLSPAVVLERIGARPFGTGKRPPAPGVAAFGSGVIETAFGSPVGWALLDLPALAGQAPAAGPSARQDPLVVEIRAVLVAAIDAWVVGGETKGPRTLQPLGTALRNEAAGLPMPGRLSSTSRGFAIDTSQLAPGAQLLVRLDGISRSSADVHLMPSTELVALLQEQERRSGMLVATLLTLACLSCVVGAITRDRNYLLFAALAVFSLLSAAFTAGLERTWVGHGFDWLLDFRLHPIVHAAKATLTLGLAWSLFAVQIAERGLTPTFRLLQATTLLMLVIAVALPPGLGLPTVAALIVPAAMLLGFALGRIALATRALPAQLYLCALGYVIACVLAEAAYFLGWIDHRPHLLNLRSGDLAFGLALGAALGADVLLASRQRAHDEVAAREQSRRLQAHRELAPAGLFSLLPDGRLHDCNRAFFQLFHLDSPPPNGLVIHWDALMGAGSFADLHACLATQPAVDRELPVRSSLHGQRCFRVRLAVAGNAWEGTIEDITARKRDERQIRLMAEHDTLTGLPNRRGLERELETAFAVARTGVPTALAYIDFDRFKLINDLFGHAAGDAVLRQSAARMVATLGPAHCVGRMGGDEFVAILHGQALEPAIAIGERILACLRDHPFSHEDKAFTIEASIGLTMVDPSLSANEVLGFADRSCAAAKKIGGSRLLAFESNSALLREHREENRLVEQLRSRLPLDRMTWHVQPIASIRHARAGIAVEALLRLVGDDGQPIAAQRVIRAAERHGMMSSIDRWMLEEILSWIESHSEVQERLAFVNLNLSGASLNDERFVDAALGLLKERSQASRKLCIEITESVALYDLANMRRLIDKIRACGVLVALDDFGAGYTSFNYLRELPADLLKIDGGFVRLMEQDVSSRGITRMIIELAHELNMGCIAEATESPEILRLLKGMRVDYAQGYAICEPLPPDEVLAAAHPHELIRHPEVRQLLRLPPILTVHDGKVAGGDARRGTQGRRRSDHLGI